MHQFIINTINIGYLLANTRLILIIKAKQTTLFRIDRRSSYNYQRIYYSQGLVARVALQIA